MQTKFRPEAITLATAVYFVAVLNAPFWQLLYCFVDPKGTVDWVLLAATALALVVLFNLALMLIAVRPVYRVVVAILLPVTAAASYVMHEYGIIIDHHMVRNVIETNSREAGDLMTTTLLLCVVGLGIVPAVVLWNLPWVERPLKNDIKLRVKIAAASMALAAATVFPVWGDVISTFRAHRELRMTLTPSNYIGSIAKYVRLRSPAVPLDVASVGEDAKRFIEPVARPHLFVVVVGETARADHFALNGYARPTTPELAKVPGLINYEHATSCGTDTAHSVPCMFSDLKQSGFTNEKAAARENLLDVLKRAGVDVVWRENQSGCKGVCERIATELLAKPESAAFYADIETHDEVLVDGLTERISTISRDTVIVLHMMGSHGPSYWKRYPPEFEKFKPVCRESQFSRCSIEKIINAYDNTVLYTDHVLAKLISVLAAADKRGIDSGMLYLSDHGESLGEHNLYLHGMPRSIAPEEQVHVPMVAWLSPGLLADNAMDTKCLTASSSVPVSHDNLFHSVLGIMDIATKSYDRKLDLFARCTQHAF